MSQGNIPEAIEDARLSIGNQPFQDGQMESNGAYRPLQDIHLNTCEFWRTVHYRL
jgi:hypothetical protein